MINCSICLRSECFRLPRLRQIAVRNVGLIAVGRRWRGEIDDVVEKLRASFHIRLESEEMKYSGMLSFRVFIKLS